MEPPPGVTWELVPNAMVPRSVFDSTPAWDAWLTEHLPEMCEFRLKLMCDFAGLTSGFNSEYNSMVYGMIRLSRWRGTPQRRSLLTDPVYMEFLHKLKKVPDLSPKTHAKDCLAEIQRQPQKDKEYGERVKQLAEKRKNEANNPTQPPPPVKDPEVLFHPLTVTESLPNGRDTVLVSGGLYPQSTQLSPSRAKGDTWMPLYPGCDLVHFGSRLTLMKEKGHLRALPLTITRSDYALGDVLTNACWDGQFLWALNPGEKGPLAVVDPREEKTWTIGPEAGLPPSISCGIAPLGHGKACVAGYFGRLWVALATFDGSRIKLEVIHEARAVLDPAYRHPLSLKRHAADRATGVAFAATVAAPAAGGQPARQRVVVGRGAPDRCSSIRKPDP